MTVATPFGREAIEEILPHREPFLLIDKVLELRPGEGAVALKTVRADEWYLTGHFPGRPVMPGVLIVEAMAQAAAVLSLRSLGQKNDGKWVYYFVGIDGARFKRPVTPGDQLRIEVAQGITKRGIAKYTAVAKVGDQVAAEAELLCALRKIGE